MNDLLFRLEGAIRPRVLLGWELGGGLGHATRLLRLAEGLMAHGFEVLAATRPGTAAPQVLDPVLGDPSRCRVIDAPVVDPGTAPPLSPPPADTLADVLIRFGYGDAALVFAAADRWSMILDRLQPVLVIADAAPSLVLTAAGRIPLVTIGPGYLMPPNGRPLPPMHPWALSVSRRSARNEQRIVDAANRIRLANGLSAVSFGGDLFAGDLSVIAARPGLDPYAAHGRRRYVAPFTLDWQSGTTPVPADAYILLPRALHQAVAVAQALAKSGLSVAIHGDEAIASSVQTLPSECSLIGGPPPPLLAQLSHSRLFVHHGSLACCEAALRIGVPQLISPSDAEKSINAALAARLSGTVEIVPGQLLANAAIDMARGSSMSGDPAPAVVDEAVQPFPDFLNDLCELARVNGAFAGEKESTP